MNEREAHYESQVKQSLTERDQAVRDVEDLRNELRQMQEEKTAREEELNETVRALTAQIETLQTELNERGDLFDRPFPTSISFSCL